MLHQGWLQPLQALGSLEHLRPPLPAPLLLSPGLLLLPPRPRPGGSSRGSVATPPDLPIWLDLSVGCATPVDSSLAFAAAAAAAGAAFAPAAVLGHWQHLHDP